MFFYNKYGHYNVFGDGISDKDKALIEGLLQQAQNEEIRNKVKRNII